jgi:hypothetical protein
MNSNHNLPNVTASTGSSVAALEDRLLDCIGSEDYVAVIRALVATRDPAAIPVLASLLDSIGPIAEESMAGLLTFGEAVVPAMRECVDSLDYDMIRHGHHVLAALGDAASKQWLRDDRAERIAAYRERVGIPNLAQDAPTGRLAGSTPARSPFESVANETDPPSRVA